MSDVQWSAREIHLPQLLNEEAIAEEFSNWEQVSSTAAERFVPRPPASPGPLISASWYWLRVCSGMGRSVGAAKKEGGEWRREIFGVRRIEIF